MFNPQQIAPIKMLQLEKTQKITLQTLKRICVDPSKTEKKVSYPQPIKKTSSLPKKQYSSYSQTTQRRIPDKYRNVGELQMINNNSVVAKQFPTIPNSRPNKINSFLLYLSNRIERQYESRKQSIVQESEKSQIANPNEAIFKEESSYKKRSNKLITCAVNNDLMRDQRNYTTKIERKQENNIPTLPNLTKKNFSLPLCPPKSPTKSPLQIKQRVPKTLQSNSSKLIVIQNKEKIYKKGYLPYIKVSKQFLEIYRSNIQVNQKNTFLNVPGITAHHYLVANRHTLEIAAQKNSQQMIEIASLTKIMTCLLAILVCEKYSVDSTKMNVRVSEKAASMNGTSANLQRGDILNLQNLLYGLMLPSGNDASVAIGEAVGKVIKSYKKKVSQKTPYETFIYHMNLFAKQLDIKQTYQNTSGLQLYPNFSTPKAVTVLTSLAMQNDKFCQIVNTKQYQVSIKNQCSGLSRKQVWKNTNKLLWKQGWIGVKTGTTEAAGHCLMACRGDWLFSVYDCSSLNKRFTQCAKLYEYLQKMNRFG